MVDRRSVLLLSALVASGCGQEPAFYQNETLARKSEAQNAVLEATHAKTGTQERVPEKVMLGAAELLAGIPGEGALNAAEIRKWLDNPANYAPLEFELPMWLKPGAGQVKDLKEDPMTRAKIELGRQLFFDKRLSADNSVSCASCHQPDKGFTVDTSLATGVKGQTRRNPPALLNRIECLRKHNLSSCTPTPQLPTRNSPCNHKLDTAHVRSNGS